MPELPRPNFRLIYVVNPIAGSTPDELCVELSLDVSRLRARGTPPPPPPDAFRLTYEAWLKVADSADRDIAPLLVGPRWEEVRSGRTPLPERVFLRGSTLEAALPEVCATGRCYVRLTAEERGELGPPARWDDGPPWRLALSVEREPSGATTLTGALARDHESMPPASVEVLHSSGILYKDGALARFDHGGAYLIAATLRNVPRVPLVEGELAELLDTLYALPAGPSVTLPDDVAIPVQDATPRPWLSVVADSSPWKSGPPTLKLGFQYGDVRIPEGHPRDAVFDKRHLALRRRDRAAEQAARARLVAAGAREDPQFAGALPALNVPKGKLAALIRELVRDGWGVDAGGVRYRSPGATRAVLRSGIDWFDLDLVVEYNGVAAPLPALLDALRERESTVLLADGSVGLLPLEWLSRFGPALAVGTTVGNVARFSPSQLGFLDALLAAMPDISADETFEKARARLKEFDAIAPVDPAPTFVGTLREYQRDGLGWLHFLREFGLGGCLADDMGLGKTVQVLALLDALHARDEASRVADDGSHAERRPSLIVVPRSLVFNWAREAERFAPTLSVLDYSGPRRRISHIRDERTGAAQVDVVLATYGTVRSDIAELSTIDFEYVILDEAQAIKNPQTASAKAARLLRARHRLALTGTPIENRLEDLWSLFSFLNPGMLGPTSTVGLMADLASDTDTDDERGGGARDILRRALRPVILRRTKEQVAPELPERCEQTLYVDLEAPQRTFYMELLAETRRTVFDEIDRVGVDRARMHILTALLRLRQAACHPVLADHTRPNLPSAKLDALVPSLVEIVDEGHKAVVFSQFTSFLALVRRRLEEAGIAYEYLDGSTRDREQRVNHFQSETGPPVFLVSLKAGGHGLNLTAADYVYLLDPWWNPAVEAQAIDRAHRIGQTRRVIATRLVARATIEEKVLDLQASKRALADAILGGDQGVLSTIGREELEMLLSPG